jgi:hypothetical protein
MLLIGDLSGTCFFARDACAEPRPGGSLGITPGNRASSAASRCLCASTSASEGDTTLQGTLKGPVEINGNDALERLR